MQYKKVKMIDEEISALAIGCWNFGGEWEGMSDDKAIEIVNTAIDGGINFFDIAPVYGWTHAEIVLGKALGGGLRDRVLIASKGGVRWDDDHKVTFDLSRANLMREIDESLKRLNTDHIDIYQMHWPDPNTPIEETAMALLDIKKAGKIRYVGLSNFAQTDVEKFMEYIDANCQQGLYNMFERNTNTYHNIPLEYKTEKEMLVTVKKYGQAFLPYSPFMQGVLTGSVKPGKVFLPTDVRRDNPKLVSPKIEVYYDGYCKLKAVADDLAKPMNELAVNWLRQKEEVTAIIGGVSSTKQLKENFKAIDWDIPKDAMERIEQILKPYEDM